MIHRLFPTQRMPAILQMTFAECGAACLAMILNYHGHEITLGECRERFGAGRDGVTAFDIVEVAEQYHLTAEGYEVEWGDFSQVPLPAIAFWDDNHFVVVEKYRGDQMWIIDPGFGRVKLTAAEFEEHYSGVVLVFSPSDQFTPRQRPNAPPWLTYLRGMLVAPHAKKLVGGVLGASLLLQGVGLVLPLFTRYIVDTVVPQAADDLMLILGLGVLTVLLAQFGLTYGRALILIQLQTRFDEQMMLDFFAHVLSLPVRFFQQRTSGDMLLRLSSNMAIREMLTDNALSTLLDGFFVLIYLTILLIAQPLFGSIVFLLGAVQIALLLLTAAKMRWLTQRALISESKSHGYLIEALTGIDTIKAAGVEERSFHHWQHLFGDYLAVLIRQSRYAARIEAILSTLRVTAPIFLLWVGAGFVLNGSLTLGTMLALNALAVSFLTPLTSLVSNGQQWQLVSAHLTRVTDVMEAEPEQMWPVSVAEEPSSHQMVINRWACPSCHQTHTGLRLTGYAELRQVSFRYSPNAPLVLDNVSLTIRPQQKIAIVGATGSGKSSVALLLLGLYAPTAGEILYDDTPLSALDYQVVRHQYGAVLQQTQLFHGRILDNITLNRPIPHEQIIAAAQNAMIHDEIMAMPMTYDTILTEDGGGLSGGQKQRLLLARALAAQPRILLLDEATSQVDALTEQKIAHNLNQLDQTQIIIAHRLSTIQDADQIVVMAHGKIVEQGTHSALLARAGAYAQLVRAQTSAKKVV